MNRTLRPLREDDLDEWIRIRAASFPPHGPVEVEAARERLAPRLPWTWGAEVEGSLTAVATWFPFRAWVGGVLVETGALGGVVSAPEHRRRGNVRALLLDGLRKLHERGVGFALEHPFDTRFYAALGFRSVPSGTRMELPLERVAGDPKRVAFAPVPRAAGDAVPADLLDLHARFARRWTFAPDRDWRPEGEEPGGGPQWRASFEASARTAPPVAYLAQGGYAVVTVGDLDAGGVLQVEDAAWSDAAARGRVLAMLGAWRGQAERLRIDLPCHDPVARDEGPRYGIPRPSLQARIVDLPGALRPLRASLRGRGEPRTIRIRDEGCPWNDGTWRIAPGPDGTEVDRARGAAEATIDAAALVSLLTGTPAELVVDHGEAEGDASALAALADLTAAHPPFLGAADYF